MSNSLSKLETDLDKRLSNRLAELVDKRVNPEMKKARTEEDNRMCNIRPDMTSELEELGVKVNSITDTLQADVSASASDNAMFTLCPRRPQQSRFRPLWTKWGDRNTT